MEKLRHEMLWGGGGGGGGVGGGGPVGGRRVGKVIFTHDRSRNL